MRREAERKLGAGRMSPDDNLSRIKIMGRSMLNQKLVGRPDIGKGAGPRAAFVAYSPVFEVCGRQALRCQRCAQMPRMIPIVFRAPVAAMDIDHEWQRIFAF